MNKECKNYKTPFILAITLHLLLGIVLFIKFTSTINQLTLHENGDIIQATTVTSSAVTTAITKINAEKIAEQQKQQQQLAEQKNLKEQEQRKEALAKQKIIEQQKVEQKIAQEQAQAKADALLKQHLAAEQKKEAQELQKKMQAEKQTLAKQQMLNNLMAKQLAQEKQNLSRAVAATAARAATNVKTSDSNAKGDAKNLSEIEKYKALIIQAISQQWIIPQGVDKNATCILLIKLAPGGDVLNIQVVQSSGNDILDRSAKTAVMQAAPLPVPKELTIFDSFRTLKLTVHPTDLGLQG